MRSLGYLLVIAILHTAPPARASSITCARDTIVRADPADGARGVPTNQALVLDGVFDAKSIRLENERGDAIPFALNAGPWLLCPGTSADVVPRAPLASNTPYVLRVSSLDGKSTATVAFTTGSTSLPEISFAPARLTATVLRGAPDEYDPTRKLVLACLGTPDREQVELVAKRGRETLFRTTAPVVTDGFYRLPKVPDAIELRRRLPTGRRSEPATVRGKALRVQTWKGSNDERPRCQNGVIDLVRTLAAQRPPFLLPRLPTK